MVVGNIFELDYVNLILVVGCVDLVVLVCLYFVDFNWILCVAVEFGYCGLVVFNFYVVGFE